MGKFNARQKRPGSHGDVLVLQSVTFMPCLFHQKAAGAKLLPTSPSPPSLCCRGAGGAARNRAIIAAICPGARCLRLGSPPPSLSFLRSSCGGWRPAPLTPAPPMRPGWCVDILYIPWRTEWPLEVKLCFRSDLTRLRPNAGLQAAVRLKL